MSCVQNFQLDFDHAVEISLVFASYKNLFLSLAVSLDLPHFSDDLEAKIILVNFVGQLYLSVVLILVVHEDVNLSADKVYYIERSHRYFNITASVENHLVFEEAQL